MSILARGTPELVDVAEDVEKDRRLIPEHPRVMARRHVEDLVRPDLDVLAICHLDREPPGQQELQVVDPAERLVDLPAHVRRPAEAGLDRSEADRQRADPDDVHRQPWKLEDLVGCIEALALDAAHVTGRVTVLAPSVKIEGRGAGPPSGRRFSPDCSFRRAADRAHEEQERAADQHANDHDPREELAAEGRPLGRDGAGSGGFGGRRFGGGNRRRPRREHSTAGRTAADLGSRDLDNALHLGVEAAHVAEGPGGFEGAGPRPTGRRSCPSRTSRPRQ